MGQSSSTPTTVTGVNEIPPPQFDANANAPPQKQHDRVIDFVRVSLKSIMSCDGMSGICIAGDRCRQAVKARLDVRAGGDDCGTCDRELYK